MKVFRHEEPRTRRRRAVDAARVVNTAEVVLAPECRLRPALRLLALAIAAGGNKIPAVGALSRATGFPPTAIPRMLLDLVGWNGAPPPDEVEP